MESHLGGRGTSRNAAFAWRWRMVAAFVLAGLFAQCAWAQSFPSRPMRIVVPVGAGGINDIVSRLIGQKLSDAWGVPVVIENRPGASGMVGSEVVAKAPPDGHTLLMVYSSHPVNPSLYAKMPYDTVKDFEPVTMVNTVNLVLVVSASVPVKSAAELIALAREQPGKLNYGAVGTASLGHLAAVMFRQMAGVDIVHIPYKGAPQVNAALLSGEASIFFDSPITALPFISSGKTRALAVTSAVRSAALPDVPTLAESGLAGYEVVGYNGLLVPGGTPRPIVNRLNAEIVRILRSPEVTELLRKQGVDVVAGTPEHFGAAIRSDLAKWAKIVRDAGIRVE